jgi:hypothetical protein
MLTIFDTGAVKNAVTRHTITAVGCKWTEKVDISFVNADGVKYKPLGMCHEFPFKIGTVKFKTKVYVLEKAPFQFLLGMTFLHATGCGLFPRWNMIVMTIPSRLEIKCSAEGPNNRNSPPPLPGGSRVLASGPVFQPITDDMEEDPMDLGAVATVQCNTMLTAPALALLATPGAILLGQKDLVSEPDGFMEPAEFEAMTAHDWDHLRPVLTIDFVKSQIKMGPEVPMEVANGVCLDIIEFADCYSWHEFDLGRIEDVKHVIEPIDDNSVVAPSRPALYTPRNDAIIHAKCDPLVEMGVYTLAGPDSYNRSQLVIAKRPIPPEVSRKRDTDLPQDLITEDELKYYRVAHDLRGLNAKCRLRPWPMTTLSEMSLWIANRSVFFSVDADRGFQQIVNDPGSVKFTSFEIVKPGDITRIRPSYFSY